MASYGMTTYDPSLDTTQGITVSSSNSILSSSDTSSDLFSYKLKTPNEMIKAPEEEWEKNWATFQVNPFKILLDPNWWFDISLNLSKQQLGDWYDFFKRFGIQMDIGDWENLRRVQLPQSMGGTTYVGSVISYEDAYQSMMGKPYDINQVVLEHYNKFFQMQQQQIQNLMGMMGQAPEIQIEIPDVSEALAILQDRLGEIYQGVGGDIWGDLMELQKGLEQGLLSSRGRVMEDLPTLLGYSRAGWDEAISQARGEIGGARGRVMEDLPTLLGYSRAGWDEAISQARGEIGGARGRVESDLERLLAHKIWEEPIEQAREIARGEALRFMDVAGIGGLGGSALMMSDIMQEAVQPLLVEKSRGQQALLRGTQEALAGLEQLGVRTIADLLGQKEMGATQLLRGTQEALAGLEQLGVRTIADLLGQKEMGATQLLRGTQDILGALETTGIRGLTELLGGAQAQLGALTRDYFRMMYELPFEVEQQALAEAAFKYGTALDYYMAQLEPFRLILGAQSSEGIPPSNAEQFWTMFAAFM